MYSSLFISEFIQVLPVHPCRTPTTFSCFPAYQEGPFLSLEEAIEKNQQAVQNASSLQGYAPWDSSKQVFEQDKVCSEVQNCDPAFCSTPASQEPEHISWLLQPRLPLTFISTTSSYLFVSIRSVRVCPLIGFFITCVRKLPSVPHQKPPGLLVSCCIALLADIGMIEVPHKDKVLRT